MKKKEGLNWGGGGGIHCSYSFFIQKT
jgi:hypothetical protein